MSIDVLSAAKAYGNQMKMMQGVSDPGQEEAAAQSPFAKLVGNALSGAADTQRAGESAQMQSLTGKVELSDLVTAVNNAELSLDTIVAVRDRIINAYEDIAKMPI